MKHRLFTLFVLLILMLAFLPMQPVQADLPDSPLYASGDFLWAKNMGGTNSDYGRGIAVDSNGNVYTTGTFDGTADFDPGAGTFNLTSAGVYDIFVSKLDSSGNFLWAKSMGGADYNWGVSIAVDTNGNVYTTGFFEGTADFDPGTETFNLTSVGSDDIFVSKLDSSGNFVWARHMGGTNHDDSRGVAVDSNGNVYTTGYFIGTADFDPGGGVFNLTSAGLEDIFVSKLDSSGNFLWAKNMGGTSSDGGLGIAVDSNSYIYTTGGFEGTADFDPGTSTFNLISAGGVEIFVSKLDSSGNFVWAKSVNGTGNDFGISIAVDSNGNVYTTGGFSLTADFDPGTNTFNLTSAGSHDIFVSKLDSSGNFVWAKSMGGTGLDNGHGIAVDSNGSVYITGYFVLIVDFDPGTGTFNLTSAGFEDIFVSKLDSNGNFVWAKSMGGTEYDDGLGIAVDSNGSIYTTGYFALTADFDPGTGTFNLTSAGNYDIFVSKLDTNEMPTDITLSNSSIAENQLVGTLVGNLTTADPDTGDTHTYSFCGGADDGSFTIAGDALKTAVIFDYEMKNTYAICIRTDDGNSGTFDKNFTINVTDVNETFTATFRSIGANDGWILESSETSNVGGTLDSTAATFFLGDDTTKKQYRGILSFTTGAGLPDTAVITKVTLKVKKQGITGGGNPVTTFQGFMVDIKKGFFGKAALQTSDFQTAASKSYGPFMTALGGGWYSIDLASGNGYINKLSSASGLTQIRLRFKLDDNNNTVANYLSLYSGNAPAASRPQLIVEYFVP